VKTSDESDLETPSRAHVCTTTVPGGRAGSSTFMIASFRIGSKRTAITHGNQPPVARGGLRDRARPQLKRLRRDAADPRLRIGPSQCVWQVSVFSSISLRRRASRRTHPRCVNRRRCVWPTQRGRLERDIPRHAAASFGKLFPP